MRIAAIITLLMLFRLVQADEAQAVGSFELGPWRLGMSREQVQSFAQFGPYVPVEVTGGLETFNAMFQGQKANASFVFAADGLQHIQLWKYEGKDVSQAQSSVVDIFRLFSSQFGGAEVENVNVSGEKGLTEGALNAVLAKVLGTARDLAAEAREKQKRSVTFMFDMKPLSQPTGSRLHSQWGYSSKHDMFYVFLFQDRPDAPLRRVEANVQLGEL